MSLYLKIIRKKFFKILLSMTIIISLGVALLFGLMNGVFSLNKSVNSISLVSKLLSSKSFDLET